MNVRPPKLRKAKSIIGKSLRLRDAAISDAEFILSLRLDEKKSKFLSKVSSDLAAQQSWLEQYADSRDQAYFIIEYQGETIGTVRLYDERGDSFCWGSWILAEGRPSHAAMESALMIYAYATDHLGFTAAHFEVRKGNERVWQFHERFGAHRTSETEEDYLYQIDLPAIQSARRRYAKFLPEGVQVEF